MAGPNRRQQRLAADGKGWAAERIPISVGSWGDKADCGASIYAQPVGGSAWVGLQIWDPRGWRLLTATAPSLSRWGYRKSGPGR